MCIAYSVLSCKLATRFSTFSILILSGKNGKSSRSCLIFQDIEHQLEEHTLRHFLRYSFFMKLL